MNHVPEIHLKDYLAILRKRVWAAAAFFVAVVTLVVLRTFSATPVYTATTRILVERNNPATLNTGTVYPLPYEAEFYNTQFQLIRSPAIARKVAEHLGPAARPVHPQPGSASRILAFLRRLGGEPRRTGPRSSSPPDPAEELATLIDAGLTVNPVRETKIVSVDFSSPDPEFAARVVNAVAQAYTEELVLMKTAGTRQAIELLTAKARDERNRLEDSERRLQEYVKANDIVTVENRVAVLPQKLADLSTQLTRTESRRKELEALVAKIESLADPAEAETIPPVSSSPPVQALRTDILRAEQNVAELSKKYGRQHPTMIAARDALDNLRRTKSDEIARIVRSLRNEFELARTAESDLRRRLDETKAEVQSLNERIAGYEALKREAETNRQLHDALVIKAKEQDLTDEIQSVSVYVIETASVPEHPTSPRPLRSLALALVVGLFGGIGLAFFLEYFDTTIKSPEEAERRIGLPVLGIIQRHRSKESRVEEVTIKEPLSPIAESFKALRTSILLSSPDTPPATILVTSCEPGDGKTATAVNLAVAVAETAHKVLLIDGDLRRPRIHAIFGMENLLGLSTSLAGLTAVPTPPSSVDNLSVMPAGPPPPNPSRLLNPRSLATLLGQVSASHDVVIFDSPPLLSVADTLAISREFDTTILVVRAGKTTYEATQRAVKLLSDIGVRVLGLVINDVHRRAGRYYRKYLYYGYPARTTTED